MCQGFSYLNHVGRLVALAASDLRRKKWRIRLGQNAVERQIARHILQMPHFGISDVACERNQEAHIQTTPRLVHCGREAVENSAQSTRSPIFFEDRQTI